jgi:hypothetical protein
MKKSFNPLVSVVILGEILGMRYLSYNFFMPTHAPKKEKQRLKKKAQQVHKLITPTGRCHVLRI